MIKALKDAGIQCTLILDAEIGFVLTKYVCLGQICLKKIFGYSFFF